MLSAARAHCSVPPCSAHWRAAAPTVDCGCTHTMRSTANDAATHRRHTTPHCTAHHTKLHRTPHYTAQHTAMTLRFGNLAAIFVANRQTRCTPRATGRIEAFSWLQSRGLEGRDANRLSGVALFRADSAGEHIGVPLPSAYSSARTLQQQLVDKQCPRCIFYSILTITLTSHMPCSPHCTRSLTAQQTRVRCVCVCPLTLPWHSRLPSL